MPRAKPAARASDRVASARSPAEAVLIQLINCRTIMVLPAYYATRRHRDAMPLQEKINHDS